MKAFSMHKLDKNYINEDDIDLPRYIVDMYMLWRIMNFF